MAVVVCDPSQLPDKPEGEIWVLVDGCYDITHFGHSNLLRQAKALGHKLVVGVHSDEEIMQNKGPPVFSQEDRISLVRAIKWVDFVVPDWPYLDTVALLDAYKCDFFVHGDDPTTSADGSDPYADVKAGNRFKECPRTAGISTTDLVGRMLLVTKTHHQLGEASSMEKIEGQIDQIRSDASTKSPYTGVSQFLSTSRKISQFASGKEPSGKIVYVDGAFDLFNIGHLKFLEKARELGDYLIVGLHSDRTVNRVKGSNHPIMNIHERTLSVLACRYVDDVVIDAPYVLDKELVDHLKIDVVAHGRTPIDPDQSGKDPYHFAKSLDLFTVVDSGNDMSTHRIIERIIENRKRFMERNEKKGVTLIDRN